jgi:hypothetical protein
MMEILPPPPGFPPLPPPPAQPEPAKAKRGRGRPREAGQKTGGSRYGARFANSLGRLFAGEVDKIGQAVIRRAAAGDMTAAKLVLDRIWPARRGRPVQLPDFPDLVTTADIPHALIYLVRRVADGTLTSSEAADLALILSKYTESIQTIELSARLDAIERTMPCR